MFTKWRTYGHDLFTIPSLVVHELVFVFSHVQYLFTCCSILIACPWGIKVICIPKGLCYICVQRLHGMIVTWVMVCGRSMFVTYCDSFVIK